MTFTSPAWFLALAAVVALLAAYVVQQLRRPRYAVRFTNLELLDVVAPKRPGARRHLPAAALLLALGALVFGLARPVRSENVPVERATVILAMDVSNSMQAKDVAPDRITAAKVAAAQFVQSVGTQVRVGLVTFTRTPAVRVSPTLDRPTLVRAVEGITLGPGTAIGEAIFTSLDAIAADLGVEESQNGNGGSTEPAEGPPAATIIVMSDGKTIQGRPDSEAAAAAKQAGIPVTTIAFGTEDGTIELGGEEVPVPVDGPALKAIADETGGQYFSAVTAQQLVDVLDDLSTKASTETREVDLSPWFVGGGLALLGLAAVGSLMWFSRLP